MVHEAKVYLTTATKEGKKLPPGQDTEIKFWPSGGRDVKVLTDDSGEKVRILFADKGWTHKDVFLEITGKDLNVVFKSTR